MKKNMLIRIVSLLCVVACLFAFASCHEDLATKEELNNATTTNKTDLTEAQKALYEAMDAVKATADAAATKAALEEVKAALEAVKGTSDAAATQEALENALASLAEVKATADAAATQTALNELKASLEAAIAAVKTTADAAATQAALEAAIAAADKANTDLKTELDAKIEANTTLIGTKVTELQAAIDAVKATADAAATKEALDAAVADITADLEAVKTTADAAATKTALDAVIADLAAVKTTADAAATQTALDAVIADLAAVKGTSDAAATKVALDAAIAEINAVKSTYATKAELEEVSTLLATVKNTADAAATKEALTAAQAALNAALTAANGNIAANAEAINGIKESIKTLATAENLAAVNAELANVKATADAAQTAEEVAAAIDAAIANLKLDDKIAAAKTELGNNITALETKLAADIQANADEIAALKTEIANLKLSVGDKTEVTNLATKVAKLEESLETIQNGAIFKDAYINVTTQLLNPDYEYSYSKFLEIVLEIGDGPYDPEQAKIARLDAEDILFQVTRAISLDDLEDLYNQLTTLKNGLKTLEESLTEKVYGVDNGEGVLVGGITYVNTTEECENKITAAHELYAKMATLKIEFQNAQLKADFERIWNAYNKLNDFVEEAAKIDSKVNEIVNIGEVILGTEFKGDHLIITTYQGYISTLKSKILAVTEYRDLYEAGLVEELLGEAIVSEVTQKIYDREYNNFLANNALKDYIDAAVAAYLGAVDFSTEGQYKTEYDALYAEKFETLKQGYIDNDGMSDVDAEAKAIAEIKAEAAANAEAKATEASKVGGSLYVEAETKRDEDAKAAANTYVENADDEIYARAMAEHLYNEDAAEAVAERYAKMVEAKLAAADLITRLNTLLGKWKGEGLLYNDKTAAEMKADIDAWTKNVTFKSTNEDYIAAFPACGNDISIANRDFVFGTSYNSTSTTYYGQLVKVIGYVEALMEVYNNFAAEKYGTTGVVALLEQIKDAINDGSEFTTDNPLFEEFNNKVLLNLDSTKIDDAAFDVAKLDAAIAAVALETENGVNKNCKTMVNDAVRGRIEKIKEARTQLAGFVNQLKSDLYDYWDGSKWNVKDINAADTLDSFRANIDGVYKSVRDNIVAADYTITVTIISVSAEEAIQGAYASFLELTQAAVDAFKQAEALIEKLEGVTITLEYGKEIYDVLDALETAKIKLAGELKADTKISFEDGLVQRTVKFGELDDRLGVIRDAYADLAADAVADAATLTDLINNLVGKSYDATKLNNFNEIVKLMRYVEVEWLGFYADGTLIADPDDYVNADIEVKIADFANRVAALKAAVEKTEGTKYVGGQGATYAFLTSQTLNKLVAMAETAVNTYKTVNTLASEWITDANEIMVGWTFHDWNSFESIMERYNGEVAGKEGITKLYYTTFDANTDPGFGLYATYEQFAVVYEKCKTAYNAAGDAIEDIHDAIDALGAYGTITLDNTGTIRTTIDGIKASIEAFKVGFCNHATEEFDGHPADLNKDKLFKLYKYEGVLQVAEHYVSLETELKAINWWTGEKCAEGMLKVTIESMDKCANEVEVDGYVKYQKSLADSAIAAANAPVNP